MGHGAGSISTSSVAPGSSEPGDDHGGLDSRPLRARLGAAVGTASPRQIRSGRRPPVCGICSSSQSRAASSISAVAMGGMRSPLRSEELRSSASTSRSHSWTGRQLSAERPARVRWIRGDMRRLPFRSGCAGAAIVIDALGFFDTEEEHKAVLLEASRVVTIGGRLALKVVNGGPASSFFILPRGRLCSSTTSARRQLWQLASSGSAAECHKSWSPARNGIESAPGARTPLGQPGSVAVSDSGRLYSSAG